MYRSKGIDPLKNKHYEFCSKKELFVGLKTKKTKISYFCLVVLCPQETFTAKDGML